MRLTDATLDHLARMVIGDDHYVPPFFRRSVDQLTVFFAQAGMYDKVYQGIGRQSWTYRTLHDLNEEPESNPDLPSTGLIAVIEHLVDPRQFSMDPDRHQEAIDLMSKLLAAYDLAIEYDHATKRCTLVSQKGTFVSTAIPTTSPKKRLVFTPSVFDIPDDDPDPNLVAVMMPFKPELDGVYPAIEQACCQVGLHCLRVDKMWLDSRIVQDIFSLIVTSRIVIVDFTGRNPNVMYETGIAHTLGKHVVPITQKDTDVPFDLGQHRYLLYLRNDEGLLKLTNDLERRLRTLTASHPEEGSSPRVDPLF